MAFMHDYQDDIKVILKKMGIDTGRAYDATINFRAGNLVTVEVKYWADKDELKDALSFLEQKNYFLYTKTPNKHTLTIKKICDDEGKFMHYVAESYVNGNYQVGVGKTEEDALRCLKSRLDKGIDA